MLFVRSWGPVTLQALPLAATEPPPSSSCLSKASSPIKTCRKQNIRYILRKLMVSSNRSCYDPVRGVVCPVQFWRWARCIQKAWWGSRSLDWHWGAAHARPDSPHRTSTKTNTKVYKNPNRKDNLMFNSLVPYACIFYKPCKCNAVGNIL